MQLTKLVSFKDDYSANNPCGVSSYGASQYEVKVMRVLFDLLTDKTRDVEDHHSQYKRGTRKILDQLLIQLQKDEWIGEFEINT